MVIFLNYSSFRLQNAINRLKINKNTHTKTDSPRNGYSNSIIKLITHSMDLELAGRQAKTNHFYKGHIFTMKKVVFLSLMLLTSQAYCSKAFTNWFFYTKGDEKAPYSLLINFTPPNKKGQCLYSITHYHQGQQSTIYTSNNHKPFSLFDRPELNWHQILYLTQTLAAGAMTHPSFTIQDDDPLFQDLAGTFSLLPPQQTSEGATNAIENGKLSRNGKYLKIQFTNGHGAIINIFLFATGQHQHTIAAIFVTTGTGLTYNYQTHEFSSDREMKRISFGPEPPKKNSPDASPPPGKPDGDNPFKALFNQHQVNFMSTSDLPHSDYMNWSLKSLFSTNLKPPLFLPLLDLITP